MKPLRRSRLAEQTAVHISTGIREGHWAGGLPGVNRLAAKLGVSRETVRAALQILENSGQVASAGHGRRRVANPASRAIVGGKKLRVDPAPSGAGEGKRGGEPRITQPSIQHRSRRARVHHHQAMPNGSAPTMSAEFPVW